MIPVAADLKTVCRLAYREGLADTLLFDKVHIERGDKKTPKALDKGYLCFVSLQAKIRKSYDTLSMISYKLTASSFLNLFS